MLFRAPKRLRAARQWLVLGSKDVALDEVNIYLLPIDEIQFRCSWCGEQIRSKGKHHLCMHRQSSTAVNQTGGRPRVSTRSNPPPD